MSKRNEDKCYNCGEKGHFQKDCKAPLVSAAARRARDILQEQSVCWNCDQKGHWRYTCPYPPRVPATTDWLDAPKKDDAAPS
jgi:hypothetical protein